MEISARHPILVTLPTKVDLGSLRKKQQIHSVIRDSLVEGCKRDRFRVCHYSVQKHELRYIVEAHDRDALSRGMQGLNVRIAKGLNRYWGRNGSVFRDRYATSPLKTGPHVRSGLLYVLNGTKSEAKKLKGVLDPYSSAAFLEGGWADADGIVVRPGGSPPVAKPKTTLLRSTWRRYGLLGVDERPPDKPI